MTEGFSTWSISSWRAGNGIGLATASSTSVRACCVITFVCFHHFVQSFFLFFFIRISVSKQLKASGEGVLTVRHVSVTDIPMSVGITEPHTHTSQLNAAEFLWDLSKRASVFVQVHKSTDKISP